MGERWGVVFEGKRNFEKYDEELVVRGEFLLDLDWVKSWDAELEDMNRGKRGAPFEFPESLIELQAVWNQWVSLRVIEGITRQLTRIANLPDYNDFSTISRRVRKVDTEVELPKSGVVNACCDGSGIKMNQAGEYRQDKYGGKKKPYAKVTIIVNPLTKKLLGLEVHVEGEGPSEPEIAMKHLNRLYKAGVKVEKFWGDGSFDTIALFNLLDQHGTKTAIPPRENAVANPEKSKSRSREVEKYQKWGWKKWAKKRRYGLRWVGTEGIFSAVKRIFGEKTRAKTKETICEEVRRRFWAYETMKNYAQTTA